MDEKLVNQRQGHGLPRLIGVREVKADQIEKLLELKVLKKVLAGSYWIYSIVNANFRVNPVHLASPQLAISNSWNPAQLLKGWGFIYKCTRICLFSYHLLFSNICCYLWLPTVYLTLVFPKHTHPLSHLSLSLSHAPHITLHTSYS